jgi:hypothetical protein
MRKIALGLSVVVAVELMTGSAVFAGTYDFGNFTITATNSQLTSTYPGADTFVDSSDLAAYSGSYTNSVATITGGLLNPAGSTNPDSGINTSISNYLAAENNVPITISFTSNKKYFGLLWGSVDPTNTVSFFENNTPVANFTGAQLESNSNVALQYYSAPGSFVDFVADSSAFKFNQVVLSDNSEPFESANYATSGVPEPSTWAMMLLGFAGLGFAGYRQTKRKDDVAFSAA